MDHQRFHHLTRLAADAPDRRNMLKLAGAAAIAGLVGLFARADDAEAALTVAITGTALDTQYVTAKTRRAARQICRGVAAVDELLVTKDLTCRVLDE